MNGGRMSLSSREVVSNDEKTCHRREALLTRPTTKSGVIWKAGCWNKFAQTGSVRVHNRAGALTSQRHNGKGHVSAGKYKQRLRWS